MISACCRMVSLMQKIFGLKSNNVKTKSMSIVNSSTTRQPRLYATVLNGHPLEEVNQFTYLDSEICKDGGRDADVDCRVRKAKGGTHI